MDTITIINFKNYNPRADYKSLPWIRLDSNVFFDPYLSDLDAHELLFWIFLLTQCGICNKDTVPINYSGFSRLSLIPIDKIRSAVVKLEKTCLISVSRTSLLKVTNGGKKSDVRYERTNERTKKCQLKVDPPKSGIQKKEVSKSSNPGELPLMLLWNKLARAPLAQVQRMSKNTPRYKSAIARWKENPDEKFWERAISKINESDFLKGDNNRGWKADFEFLIRPGKAETIIEGKYDTGRTERKLVRTPT